MQLTYRYKLRPTKEQKATMIDWLNLCRRQYNYRLGERYRWWEATRTPINACPLNASITPIDDIYQNIPEFRVQVREDLKLRNLIRRNNLNQMVKAASCLIIKLKVLA